MMSGGSGGGDADNTADDNAAVYEVVMMAMSMRIMLLYRTWCCASSLIHLRMKVNSPTAFSASSSLLLCRKTGTFSIISMQ